MNINLKAGRFEVSNYLNGDLFVKLLNEDEDEVIAMVRLRIVDDGKICFEPMDNCVLDLSSLIKNRVLKIK